MTKGGKMDIDTLTKISQIAFYAGGLVLGLLTYRRAKATILNTINTEYHKKVIEKLADISEDLYKEFDFSLRSSRKNDVEYVVDIINKEALEFKERILANGAAAFFSGTPMSPKQVKDLSLVRKYKSEPFLPDSVRVKILNLLEKRNSAALLAYGKVMTKYQEGLAAGKYWDTLDTNWHWLNNEIVNLLRDHDAGFEKGEEEVHDIRLEIKRYFDKFTPK